MDPSSQVETLTPHNVSLWQALFTIVLLDEANRSILITTAWHATGNTMMMAIHDYFHVSMCMLHIYFCILRYYRRAALQFLLPLLCARVSGRRCVLQCSPMTSPVSDAYMAFAGNPNPHWRTNIVIRRHFFKPTSASTKRIFYELRLATI